MRVAERIIRHGAGTAFGIIIALLISSGVGIAWPAARIPVFIVFVLFWLAISVSGIISGKDQA